MIIWSDILWWGELFFKPLSPAARSTVDWVQFQTFQIFIFERFSSSNEKESLTTEKFIHSFQYHTLRQKGMKSAESHLTSAFQNEHFSHISVCYKAESLMWRMKLLLNTEDFSHFIQFSFWRQWLRTLSQSESALFYNKRVFNLIF